MSADEEPGWLGEMAKSSEALRRQMEPIVQGCEVLARRMERFTWGSEALARQFEPVLLGSEALARQMEPIVQAAERFVRDAHWPKAGSLGLPLPLQLAAAMDTAIREPKPAQRHATAYPRTLEVSVAFPAPTVITGSGDVTLPKPSLSGEGTAGNRRSGLAALSDGQIVALVLVWLYAFVLPWFGSVLPPEFHAVLSDGYATFALALTITWRMLDKNK